MVGRLQNQVALVTGGASGIGHATALAFAREGASVVVADVSREEGEGVVREAQQFVHDSVFLHVDVSRSVEVEALIKEVVTRFGRLDCAFNNAGIAGSGAPTADCAEDEWDRIIAVNLKGVWLCMKFEIMQMVRQHKGAIVNAASTAGLVGFHGSSAYSAAKGGVIQLTRTAAIEYAKMGIRINAVCPSTIRTPMIVSRAPAEDGPRGSRTSQGPIGRIGEPEEVAEAVVWLCSNASSFVLGHPLVIDGGYTAQ
jgi:NAD(P)-dependent dehydrogenase (short-subunit alcohol dehydrogenase family)